MPQIRFAPFADEQRQAMYLLVTGLFGELLRADVPTWYAEGGRGLVVFLFTTQMANSLQPPVYVGLEEWQRMPLLVNTPHDDLIEAMQTYNPAREYIVLVAGGKSTYRGLYAWWRIPLQGKPGVTLQAAMRGPGN